MKKISIMFAAVAVALGFSACNETWNDNPVLGTHEGDPVLEFLNTPEMANEAVVITEENKNESFKLTCSQPEQYGYNASVAYNVELSLNEDFTTPAVAEAPASVTLTTNFFNRNAINPTYRSVAEAICKMLDVQGNADIPTKPGKLYVRLRANVVNENGKVIENTAYTSNAVSFESVSVNYLAIITPGLPSGIYVRGDMNGWLNDQLNDGKDLDVLSNYEFLTTTEANVYELDYIEIQSGVIFKIADKGWGAPNLGIKDPIVFGEKVALGWKTENISLTSTFKGSITLSGSGENWSAIFDALEPDTPGQPSGIYLRGDMNGWGTSLEFLTTDVKGVWSLENLSISAGIKFKVADANWTDINLGGAKVDGVVQPILPGVKYSLEKGGENIEITEAFNGNATLTLKAGKYTLTLQPN